jgi:hypothetical protein
MAGKIHVGKIKATNAVIGDRGNITDKSRILIVTAEQAEVQAEALRKLREFVDLLPGHADEIDIERAREAATQAEAALKKKRWRPNRIVDYLGTIMAMVSDIEVLANAVRAVQATVERLIH